MWQSKRGRSVVVAGLTILALTAGTALGADQIWSRDRAEDGTCEALAAGGAECATEVTVRSQNRDRVGESEEASGAVRTRVEEQARTQAGCADEPVCETEEPLKTQIRDRDRDRTGENEDAPGAVRTRTEEQECNEVCAGDQGSDPKEPEGSYGPGDPARVRSGEPGAGAGGS
jgi:hypothetical protein